MGNRKIEVVEYDCQWALHFEAEKVLLQSILPEGMIRIDHIGSTSVPGLMAKPIIDIMIEVTDITLLDNKEPEFVKLGYQARGENGIAGRRYFQKGGDQRTHHIHAFQQGSEHLLRHRAFKHYLTNNPLVAKQYAKVKMQAAQNCHHDNERYMSLKDPFIEVHEKLAIERFDG